MTTIHKTAIVAYSAKDMYELVNNIESYPEFLPWCQRSAVHLKTDEQVEASLHISKGRIKIAFTTINSLDPYHEVKMRLVKGPFKRLFGCWTFTELKEDSCKISFRLEFEFSNKILALALGVIFNPIVNSMLDAFCKQAKVIYGDDALNGLKESKNGV